MKKKSIYFGGGFREHQILYMLPILDGFCSKNRIKKIIFEKKLSKSILNLPITRNFLRNYEVTYLPEIQLKRSNLILKIRKISFVLYYFFLSFFVNKKLLLNRDISWLKIQLYHSIWDTCIVNNKLKLDKFEFKSQIKSAIQIAQKKIDYDLIKKDTISYAFIQHTVYSERFLFALLRNSNVKVFVQTKHVLISQKKEIDFGFKFLDKKIFLESFKRIKENNLEKYWSDILMGKSNYLEARIAANLKNKQSKLRSKENVIMLHIFRDSPFTNIDRKRIYPDYYTWVLETLRIIKNSKERWIIRKHPSAERWGENQKVIIKEIFQKVFGNKVPKNIIFEDNQKSNLLQFKFTKRLITFSGNSHLESACFGIKPIIISNTTLCDFDKELFFKPKTFQEYENFLLKGSDEDFKIPKLKKILCKRILFLIHNVINFGNDVNSFHVFRNDPKKIFKELYKKVSIQTQKNYIGLFKIGYNLNDKYIQSINKKYTKLFH